MIVLLKKGKFYMDDEDAHLLLNHYKRIRYLRLDRKGYVTCLEYDSINKKKKLVYFHRVIMNQNNPEIFIDHIDGNTVNNRKSNLRICSKQQNCSNRTKKDPNSSSIYKGVSLTRGKRWRAAIKFNQKYYYIGQFKNEDDAARAYDKKAKEFFGEFARPNF